MDAPAVWVLSGLHESAPMSRLGVIDVYMTLIWTERWQEWGECVMQVPYTQANSSLLQPERILALTAGRQVCRIVAVEIENTPDADRITVRAADMRSVLDLRAVDGTVRAYYPADLVRKMADECIVSPSMASRRIPCISVSQTRQSWEASARVQASYCMAGERTQALERRFRFGTAMLWDGSDGIELTFSAPQDSGLVISEEHGTLGSAVHAHSTEDSLTAALVAGQGQGDDRTAVWAGSGTGILRRETAVDRRDLEEPTATVAEAASAFEGWSSEGWVRMLGWDSDRWEEEQSGGGADPDDAFRFLAWLGDITLTDPDSGPSEPADSRALLTEPVPVRLIDIIGDTAYYDLYDTLLATSPEDWSITWHGKGSSSDPAAGYEYVFDPAGRLALTLD